MNHRHESSAEAQPLSYQPGYDIERSRGSWVLYRTTRNQSRKVAQGHLWITMVLAYWCHRLAHPIQ